MASQGPIFFFHEEREHGYLSQWYAAPFDAIINGQEQHYFHAEQYMMHHKALLGTTRPDTKTIREILLNSSPRACKSLGAHLPHFSTAKWDQHKFQVVEEGSYLKFVRNAELRTWLLETGERELVEASHFDRVWGVGFTPEQCRRGKKAGAGRENWGENLLGKALMSARRRIREEMKVGGEEEEDRGIEELA